VHVEPNVHTDIFVLESEAMAKGLKDAASEGTPSSSHWLCDNMRALFVFARGWSAEWSVNEWIREMWSYLFLPSAKFSYVASPYNIVDCFTRVIAHGRRERVACALHPGTDCPEFLEFVRDVQKEMRTESEPPVRRISWALKTDSVSFYSEQPAACIAHLRE
jgi:hypothetical protein